MSRKFEGKVALVEGASSGIGKATALLFAKHGAKVIVASRRPALGEETVNEIKELGGEAIYVSCDISKHSDVKNMIEVAVATYGRIDFAYNNAGHSIIKPLIEFTEDEWDAVVDTNLKGTFLCMKYEIEQMLKQGGGVIVNCASVAGLIGVPNIAAYTAAKHGVVGLTKNAGVEYIKQGVRINVVCPGAVQTPMLDEFTGKQDAIVDYLSNRQAIGRIGEPNEIAEAVIWLCSDESSFVNATAISVDGGWTAY